MLRDFLLSALVAINGYFLVTVLLNIAYFRRATKAARITSGPLVSVIVPARNEEAAIARCVKSLLAQEYADYEVIVVDDQSTDGTAQIVSELAAHDARLRLVSGAPLPDGWLGKPHALSQGAAVARGEILILTDADTSHGPKSVSWAVTNLQDHHADMLSGYLDQEYGSLGETVIVPTMYAAMLLVPFYLLLRSKSPQLAFAIGQYVAIRRDALEGVGGYDAIKGSLVDDMSMAKLVKASGYREVFLDANEAASCRLYSGYRDAFAGIMRSVYSALGGHPLPVAIVSALVLGVIVAPSAVVLASYATLQLPVGLLAIAVALFAAQWALVVYDRDVPFLAFVFYPLVFLNLALILNASMLTTGFGRGVDWKGRLVRKPRDPGVADEIAVADAACRPGEDC